MTREFLVYSATATTAPFIKDLKGAGRMDFYTGIGMKALHKARYISHYGKVWILMPKEK